LPVGGNAANQSRVHCFPFVGGTVRPAAQGRPKPTNIAYKQLAGEYSIGRFCWLNEKKEKILPPRI
jgi:hypothetical protein